MPSSSDIDGDTIITTILSNTCTYSITYAAGALTFTPAISNIGTCIITVNLFDGINNVPYPINIVTTNSPPYFSSSLSLGETINAGATNTYTLPSTIDFDLDIVAISIS